MSSRSTERVGHHHKGVFFIHNFILKEVELVEQSIISIKDVSFRYHASDEKNALAHINLDVIEGEWLAVIGHNGSGKSTLAKIMNGLLEANEGEVFIEGERLIDETVYQLRRKVGMVFQNPDNQFVGTTVEDDIAFGLENIGLPREEMVKRISQSLEMVRMTDFKTKEPARLSGGQKQRVAIAGMTALSPKVIILDEATSMLDPLGRSEVIATIQKLHQEKGITVISITHDLDEAAQADRVMLMEAGEVQRIGTPEEIFSMGHELIEKGLDVPFSEKLKAELKKLGIEVPAEYLDEERLVDWLWTSILTK